MVNKSLYLTPIKPLSIFCNHPECERRLVLPEEWTQGYCTRHQAAAPCPDDDDPLWREWMAQIDALLEDSEMPTVPMRRMNRDA